MPTLDTFGIEPIPHRQSKPAHYRHSASAASSLFFPPVLLLLLALRKQLTSLKAKLVVPFTSCLHHGFGGPNFSTGKNPLLLCSFCCLLRFLFFAKRQFSFLPVSVDFTPLFFSNSALHSGTVVIFPKPRPENLTAFQPCLEISDSGLCYLLKLPV